MKIKVSLIGCGAVSEVLYAQALSKLESEGLAETTALVDPNAGQIAKITKFLPNAIAYANLDEMLSTHKPDLAIIASPHGFHESQTVTCLNAGIHVLCEKPMAVSLKECDQMLRTAEETGNLLAVGHFRRFFPACQLIKNVIDARSLGSVVSFQFLEGETYSWPARSTSFFKKSNAGGGVLIDTGVHLIDLLLWWLGDVAELHYQDDVMGGVETNCRLRLKMTNGAEGSVQLSRDWPLPNSYIFKLEKGWIRYQCDVVNKLEWGFYDTDYAINGELRQLGIPFNGTPQLGATVPNLMDCFNAQLRNVIGAIQGREHLSVSGKDAQKSISLIEQCYHNRHCLPMPWLEPIEIQNAQQFSYV